MRAMGLDVSTSSGMVVLEGGVPEVVHEEEIVSERAGMARCEEIVERMIAGIREFEPDEIVIEDYGFANRHSLVTLVEIGTVLRYRLHRLALPYRLVPPTSLKKFVFGSGKARKEHMLLQVYKRWGHECRSNNTADGFGLAAIGLAARGVLTVPKTLQEVLRKTRVVSACT